MKKLINNWLMSFDQKDDTGFDHKKLTAFWFTCLATFLVIAYAVKKISLFWFGVHIELRDDLSEFKYILGIVLVFILTLTYFTNSKELSRFVLKLKGDKKNDKPSDDIIID